MSRKLLFLLTLLLSVGACASAPVQEMSDARQAIRAAEEAGASEAPSYPLQQARQLLEQAQSELEAGAYLSARRLAQAARDQATLARQVASGRQVPPPPPLH